MNDIWWAAMSTMTAIMGRMAVHSCKKDGMGESIQFGPHPGSREIQLGYGTPGKTG
ncbi:MAG: hypothetical protein ABI760_05045 [Ferruginibacter sp.]